jgi:hypothetical protein
VSEDNEYVPGEDVTDVFTPTEPADSVVLELEIEVPGAWLERLDALSEAMGQSYEDIVVAALGQYAPLRQQPEAPPDRPADRRAKRTARVR